MSNAEYLLKSFATFAAERRQTHVLTQTAIDWAALGPTVAQRDARLIPAIVFSDSCCRQAIPNASQF